ncbi:D-alanine--D-alanine ligase family protein [Sanguibacter sp. A247]|uniref:D-alanine--D-alanine ligase family protein n=1 Tax=unclassified Sanguibacter TaxID=2645534 RepID=UPI003FD7E99A
MDTQRTTSVPGDRPRVMVLFGGRSGEHSISCATAAGVLRAIDRRRWEPVPVGITRAGQWVVAADDPAAWEITDGHLPEVEASHADVVLPMATHVREVQVLAPGEVPTALGDVDVVMPLIHGPFGEDGTLQGMLEMSDVRYVGAGVLASAIGMDKHYMKVVLESEGLAVAPYVVVRPGAWERDRAALLERIDELGLPLFVKPARAGSSLGISRIDNLDDLDAAIAVAREHDPKVLVEQGIVGREIECAVLGGRGSARPRASLPGEVVVNESDRTFYDFESKYLGEGDVDLVCPANLPASVIAAVQDVAVRTFEALSGEGLSRVDVFVTPDERVIVNEINTMPGFTPISMYPRMWQESGLAYAELIDELLTLALERPTGLR